MCVCGRSGMLCNVFYKSIMIRALNYLIFLSEKTRDKSKGFSISFIKPGNTSLTGIQTSELSDFNK